MRRAFATVACTAVTLVVMSGVILWGNCTFESGSVRTWCHLSSGVTIHGCHAEYGITDMKMSANITTDDGQPSTDARGIFTMEGVRQAWFKDPAGNILSVIQGD